MGKHICMVGVALVLAGCTGGGGSSSSSSGTTGSGTTTGGTTTGGTGTTTGGGAPSFVGTGPYPFTDSHPIAVGQHGTPGNDHDSILIQTGLPTGLSNFSFSADFNTGVVIGPGGSYTRIHTHSGWGYFGALSDAGAIPNTSADLNTDTFDLEVTDTTDTSDTGFTMHGTLNATVAFPEDGGKETLTATF
ncbi:MAG: hypothetical protein JST54_08905 [Deltaproteobacteria bacterium]|nr:hypothetical protein [Deltaproteobacteria bacterium]